MTVMLWIIRKYMLVLLLWLAFSGGCLLAPLAVIVLPLVRRSRYAFACLCAADRMCAALLGFSGRVTLSAELTHSDRYVWIREALDRIVPNHCEKSACNEGAYCKLSDRTLGHK